MTKATAIDDLSDKLDDAVESIAESISDLSTMMSTEFAAVRSEMIDLYAATREDTREAIVESEARILAKTDHGFAAVYKEMRYGFADAHKEMSYGFAQNTKEHSDLGRRFETQESLLLAVHTDIKELYDRIDQLRVNTKHMSSSERQRLAELEAFAMQVAEKTGIPFDPKPKRQS